MSDLRQQKYADNIAEGIAPSAAKSVMGSSATPGSSNLRRAVAQEMERIGKSR